MSDPGEQGDFRTLRVTAVGAVAELSLCRPDKLNALSRELLTELIEAAAWFNDRPEIKTVIVSGEGRAFSAGADLGAFGNEDGGTQQMRAGMDLGRRAADAIAGLCALTVVAIHGHCVGGGVVLAAACDIRIAASDARFSIPEVDIGIPLAWGGIPRLVRELGPAVTKDLVLTCRAFDAAEARQLRFVSRVVEPGELQAEARAIAEKLAGQPTYALTVTKRHVDAVAEEAGSTAESFRDADSLLTAARDEESLAAMARYLARRRGGQGA
jgi:enoyl-CoA hydratase/carnithine racemase